MFYSMKLKKTFSGDEIDYNDRVSVRRSDQEHDLVSDGLQQDARDLRGEEKQETSHEVDMRN